MLFYRVEIIEELESLFLIKLLSFIEIVSTNTILKNYDPVLKLVQSIRRRRRPIAIVTGAA